MTLLGTITYESFKFGAQVFLGNFLFSALALFAYGKDNVPEWAEFFSNILMFTNLLVNAVAVTCLLVIGVRGLYRLAVRLGGYRIRIERVS
jgi:hypothetical protein